MKVILTGATGMVGEGVMHECLLDENVTEVLLISRKIYKTNHPKIKQIILDDITSLEQHVEEISGYDACFFCMGVSSVGMKEDKYSQLTYDLTLKFAKIIVKNNSDMVFTYVSGVGTDSTEKGRVMWARVKGKTENDLILLPFKGVFVFRPGVIEPTKGMKNTYTSYKILKPLLKLTHCIAPNYICTLADIGKSMLEVAETGYNKPQIEVKDIKKLAKERRYKMNS
jgi:uncharacterized protein YbjT (DUF2867 family)